MMTIGQEMNFPWKKSHANFEAFWRLNEDMRRYLKAIRINDMWKLWRTCSGIFITLYRGNIYAQWIHWFINSLTDSQFYENSHTLSHRLSQRYSPCNIFKNSFGGLKISPKVDISIFRDVFRMCRRKFAKIG